jgi:hypothetical protein
MSTTGLLHDLSLLPGALTPGEKAAYNHFQTYMANKLPGIFESDFWEKLVLQASIQEPTIMHAAIALAAGQLGNERLLLGAYNRAITGVNERMRSQQDAYSLRLTLIACILFTALEFLRGARGAGAIHLRNGLRILKGLTSQAASPEIKGGGGLSSGRPQSADACLIEAFTRIELQFSVLDQGSEFLRQQDNPLSCSPLAYHIPLRFEKLGEARRSLDLIIHGIISISSQADTHLAQGELSTIPQTVRRRHKRALEALEKWKLGLDAGLLSFMAGSNTQTSIALDLLQSYYTMAKIMAASCMRGRDEMVFDQHQASFAELLHQISQLWQRVSAAFVERRSKYSFTLDIGYIPPLYFTALKCRDPGLRRTAVDLLRRVPHIEGAWDGTMAATVAEHVITLEETGGREYEPVDGKIVHAIPQSSRANKVVVYLDPNARTKACLEMRRYKRKKVLGRWEWECEVRKSSIDFGDHDPLLFAEEGRGPPRSMSDYLAGFTR